jgi:hypothetical protein
VSSLPLSVAVPARRSVAGWVESHAALALGLLVLASFVVRLAAGWWRITPAYLPDEFVHAELARSVAHGGLPTYLGFDSGLPGLLPAFLTAPAWLADDVETGYRLVGAIGALATSLAAVPVYLLARRAGLSRGLALGAGAYAVAIPGLLLSGWVMTEAVAYPFALAAVYAAVAALDSPTRRGQLALLALAGLAVLAKPSLVAVPAAYVAGVVVLGVRERVLCRTLRSHGIAVGALALLTVAIAARGGQGLGVYGGIGADAGGAVTGWLGRNALVLAHASGWALLPAALAAIVRPGSRVVAALATVCAGTATLLLVQAAVFSARIDLHVHERYAFYVLPVAAVLACCWLQRAGRSRAGLVALAALPAVAAVAVPVSGLAAGGGLSDSPVLRAYGLLEQHVGAASASFAFGLAALALAALGAAAAARRGRLGPVALAAGVAACVAASAASTVFDARNADRVAARLPPDPSWIDHAGVGETVLLRAPSTDPSAPFLTLFWNRDVRRVAYLPDAKAVDWLWGERAEIRPDGTILIDGAPLTSAFVVEESGSVLELTGARLVLRTATGSLWSPTGVPAARLLVAGEARDGALAAAGEVALWPEQGETLAGRLELELALPARGEPVAFRLIAGGSVRAVTLAGPEAASLEWRVCSDGAWRGAWRAGDGHALTLSGGPTRVLRAAYTPDASACP